MSDSPPVPQRLGFLTFVTVSVAAMAGVVAASLLVAMYLREDGTVPAAIGLIALPLPAIAAALGFLFVARFETGRKGLAVLSIFFGTLAAEIVGASLGLVGLVIAASAGGGFAVLARRLLDAPRA